MRKLIILITFILLMIFSVACTDILKADEIKNLQGTVDKEDVSVGKISGLEIQSKACILMEKETGNIIYEKNSNEILSPASITKIMTLLLIFEAIDKTEISLEDEVVTSAYAKSMGGSQVFLEEGEVQNVETLIKCIVIASGNDASVAMAEYISGSEEKFVEKMNNKADELGMSNTNFIDCCGLCDDLEHHTSAKDVGIMARELILRYPEVLNYSGIWMENIVHETNKGKSEFTLANTNKLLKQCDYITGLKTGSTSLAKYCVCETANKDGVELIAVIMGAPDYKTRFSEALKLLDYGYGIISIYKDDNNLEKNIIDIKGGKKEVLHIKKEAPFVYVFTNGEKKENVTNKIVMDKMKKAPIVCGEIIGKIEYYYMEEKIGEVNILSTEDIGRIGYMDYFKKLCYNYLL